MSEDVLRGRYGDSRDGARMRKREAAKYKFVRMCGSREAPAWMYSVVACRAASEGMRVLRR